MYCCCCCFKAGVCQGSVWLNWYPAPLCLHLFRYRLTCGNIRAVTKKQAHPASVHPSLRLSTFHHSISLTIHPSATVVCCHHRACVLPSVCLSTCKTPAGSYLSASVSAYLYVFMCLFVLTSSASRSTAINLCGVFFLLLLLYPLCWSFFLFPRMLLPHKKPFFKEWYCCFHVTGSVPLRDSCCSLFFCLQLWLCAFGWFWSPCFFSYISGVKRGVCSQINHFPEDADFDHDGAEYVLRKSTPGGAGMDDEADGGEETSQKAEKKKKLNLELRKKKRERFDSPVHKVLNWVFNFSFFSQ